jgi:hypothetical protein
MGDDVPFPGWSRLANVADSALRTSRNSVFDISELVKLHDRDFAITRTRMVMERIVPVQMKFVSDAIKQPAGADDFATCP